MWDRRGGGIVRVADTLIISVSQPSETAAAVVWGDGPAADYAAETADCRTPDCRSAGELGDGSPPGSGAWLGGDSDSLGGLSSAAEEPAAAGGDGIQIICRFDSPWSAERPSPCSSPPPYPPPPPPTESPPTLAALSRDVSEFSSIIEIDGDSFCIRSRLAGREEPEDRSSSGAADSDGDSERDSDDSDDSDSEGEVAALVAQYRRFNESRLLPRWPALLPLHAADADADEVTSTEEPGEEEEDEERPTSVDSGRESGADSRTADMEDGEGKRTETQTQRPPQTQTQSLPRTQSSPQTQSPLEAKMALLRREVSSLMRQDNDLFHQLLSLHDSIEALKNGEDSLSAGSSMSSLAGIDEEDTISTPSSDLDRQSHLSSETDNLSLVKGDSGSERSFFSEILHVTGMSHWAKSRLTGPDSLTPEQMALPSPRQASPPAQSPAEKVAPRSRHRKQGSCDSGIVDQEIRGQA